VRIEESVVRPEVAVAHDRPRGMAARAEQAGVEGMKSAQEGAADLSDQLGDPALMGNRPGAR
jgi:hypothetical protein